ncbi:hypothetical protein, conserved [Plasmodium gonderi]|uniref:UAS domain-containing protein n=1 Tax=Plasmodium gonderi TaxID=77519 RepID=A0A1Y1JFI3_PLAGO|nr:hypothetical protein, conserved [Plasmodium gonderi]GAW81010.1 hypothetical protein, conserved [Plasmodium gonderi]
MIAKQEIEEFLRHIEDATEDTALYYLEMCNGNCSDALNLYYEINGEPTSHSQHHNDGMGQGEETLEDADTQQVGIEDARDRTQDARDRTQNTRDRNEHVTDQMEDYSTEYDDCIREPDKHFSQALIHDMDKSNFLHFNEKNKKDKKSKIELGDAIGKLFSPPVFLNCNLSLEEVRKKSRKEDKYILVNIQDSEFESMRLNRDIWNNEVIQEIIKDFFIFWLRYEHDQDAMIFMSTYKVTKLPHICALCKRTGRKLKVWNLKNFQDPICAQSQLYEFIEKMEPKNESDNSTVNKDGIMFEKCIEALPSGEDNNKSMFNNMNENKISSTLKNMDIRVNEIHANMNKNKSCGKSTDLLKNTNDATNGRTDGVVQYNKINNELSELHKLRLQRFQKR